MNLELELITTGSELLNGRSLNTHARTLARALQGTGFRLGRDTTVPDAIATIRRVLEEALGRVPVVVVSGGLGPTSDDITRDAVAQLLDRTILMDEAARAHIRELSAQRGLDCSAARQRQALVVEGATVLANTRGAAPGERLEYQGKTIFLLPGPAWEFEQILADHVLPWLRTQAGQPAAPVERIFMVCMAESDIMTRMAAAGFPPAGIELGWCAAPGRVELRLSAPGQDPAVLDAAARAVPGILGPAVFADYRAEMEEVVGQRLARMGATLATAESCTGGLLGHLLTSVSGSSAYYLGGVITYSNESKIKELGISPVDLSRHGAVSEPVARHMAAGVRRRFNATYGLSVTGIAGPTGGTPAKPVGLVYISVATPERIMVEEQRWGPIDRSLVQQLSARAAMNLLRLALPPDRAQG